LLLAARQLIGMMIGTLTKTDGAERLHGELVALRRLHLAATVEQWELDVVERRRSRQQVEALEHEPNLPVADLGKLILRHLGHILTVQDVLPRGRAIETPEDVHQRGLAGTRRPRDREKFALPHIERHAAQRPHLDFADHIGFDQIPDRDDGGRLRHSNLSASIGSRRAAFCAG
jgi:hypothetical protein